MLASIGFIFFLAFALFMIYRVTRKSVITLEPMQIIMAFVFKVILGCLYGFIFLKYYGGDDTWMLHNGSVAEYQKLMHSPELFLADFDLTATLREYGSFAAAFYVTLSDIEYWIITKSLGVLNMFSRGNYYINVIFFNLMTFWGQYLIFKLFAASFPARKTLIFFLVFFIPSISFWLSGIRPDGFLMLSAGLTLYYFYAWGHSRRVVHLLAVFAGVAGLVIFRSPVLLLLLPALIAWALVRTSGWKTARVFAVVYILATAIFFGSAWVNPRNNLLTFVSGRQHQFLELEGTRFELNRLEPEPVSFLKTLPQAFANTFLRPFPWEAKGPLQWMTAIDTVALLLLMVFAFFGPPAPGWAHSPVTWTILLFGLTLYLFIGLTIPFPGAIARYKVVPELLLLVAICVRPATNQQKI